MIQGGVGGNKEEDGVYMKLGKLGGDKKVE